MSSPMAIRSRKDTSRAEDMASGSPDVDWLLDSGRQRRNRPAHIDLPGPQPEPTPPQSPTPADEKLRTPIVEKPAFDTTTTEVKDSSVPPATPPPAALKSPPVQASIPPSEPSKQNLIRPNVAGRRSTNETPPQAGTTNKGPPSDSKNRKTSFFSSLSSKFGSSSPGPPVRSASYETPPKNASPAVVSSKQPDFANPFEKKELTKKEAKKEAKVQESKVVYTTHHVQPRRQSVLVQAGQERKDSNSGFLQNALRRLSASGPTGAKAATAGAIVSRKIMNVDQNRDRVKIADFDQNKLKRVAFCVDVEIAGYAQAADEDNDGTTQTPVGQRMSLAMLERSAQMKQKKDVKDAKYKEKGEGAALKNPRIATEEKEDAGVTQADAAAAAAEVAAVESKPAEETPPKAISPEPTTRKKEKKKRSEAERKERRERKRRRAEANGEVPLELSGVNDDSDSSPGNTPPGASSPSLKSDQPTTDPLRIYKRCCQLRETTTLKAVTDQVSKPSSTLAEASGTVGVLDLSGSQIPLEDIVTLSDWLALVPVRKLMLDGCGLTDESLRVVLSGLVGCKSSEQAKQNRKLPKWASGKQGQEHLGVIEKLSLKNNPQLTAVGWKHIALFLHISRSIRAIDLSGNPFPKSVPDSGAGDLSRTSTTSTTTSTTSNSTPNKTDISTLFGKALRERFGDKLEELILSGCGLSTANVVDITDCAVKCKFKRLGLADNDLSQEALEHVVSYLQAGVCEGLDLGRNNLRNRMKMLCEAADGSNPFFALSLSGCNLTTSDLTVLLPSFAKLPNFRFLDLSHNRDLFTSEPNAVPVFRKYLPKFKPLRRIHLADVNMTSDHAIALSEVLPECLNLSHISILENPRIVDIINAKEEASQEEASALFASLMTAARVSHSIIAIEVEVPGVEASEVVRALASQVVAYCLRNMEGGALDEMGVPTMSRTMDKDTPEVLLHLVGHTDGYSENHDGDEPSPDEDYVIASTGIVKALGVCLGTRDGTSRGASRNISPAGSGTATPRQGGVTAVRPNTAIKPRDVSLELCESARKIRMRLRPALIREDRAGNDMAYRRIQLLDSTLERMIQRFEEMYPETKVPPVPSPPDRNNNFDFGSPHSLGSSLADASILSASTESNGLSNVMSAEEVLAGEANEEGRRSLKLPRNSSNTSLARAQIEEEGRMHRFGQTFRREVLDSSNDEPEAAHLAALRERLEALKGDEIKEHVERDGADDVIKKLNISAQELMMLEKEDPAQFERFRQSQLAAQINAGRRNADENTAPTPSIYV